jgi:PST family polysaccharide transporter
MSLKQKAIKGMFWSAVQNWGTQAVTFIVFTLLARILEPKAFGLVALAGVFVAFVQVFLDRGFSVAIVQRQKLDPEHLDTALWTGIAISAETIAELFKESELTPIIRWLALVFVIRSFSSVQDAILKRELKFKVLALRSTIAVVVSGVVATIMAFMGFGVWCLVAQQLTNAILQVIVLWCVSDWKPKFRFSRTHFRDLFSFAINIVGIDLLSFLQQRGDNFLIGYFLGPVALGYYSIAYRLLWTVTQLLVGILSQVALPAFSKLQEQPLRLKKAFYEFTFASSLIAIPIFIALATLAPELIKVMFGEKWLPSVTVTQILASVGIVQSFVYFNTAVITALGKPSWRLVIDFFSTLISLTGFAIAVSYGIVAVATAHAVTNLLLYPVFIWVAFKLVKIEIKTLLNQFSIPIFCSAIMFLFLAGIKFLLYDIFSSLQLLFISIPIGLITYLLTLFVIKPELFKQIEKLISSILSTTALKK